MFLPFALNCMCAKRVRGDFRGPSFGIVPVGRYCRMGAPMHQWLLAVGPVLLESAFRCPISHSVAEGGIPTANAQVDYSRWVLNSRPLEFGHLKADFRSETCAPRVHCRIRSECVCYAQSAWLNRTLSQMQTVNLNSLNK